MFVLRYDSTNETEVSLELYLFKRSGTRIDLSDEVQYGRIVHLCSHLIAYMSQMLAQIASAKMVLIQFGLKCTTLNRRSFSLEDSGCPGWITISQLHWVTVTHVRLRCTEMHL